MTLKLERFSTKNTDLVLSWRNLQEVRNNFLDDHIISKEEHLSFLELLKNNEKKHYFILKINEMPISVMYVELIDNRNSIYWGCYIGNREAIVPGLFPIMIAICSKFAFQKYKCEKIKSDVLSHNLAPQHMNKFLGIKKINERMLESNKLCFEYEISKKDWEAIEKKINKIITKQQKKMLDDLDISLI